MAFQGCGAVFICTENFEIATGMKSWAYREISIATAQKILKN